jgi:exosortase/archaeosortase family protein
MKTLKIRVPKEYRNKFRFTFRLLLFGIAFYLIWSMSPTFYLLKRLTAEMVSATTGAEIIDGMDGIFVRKAGLIQIVTDCTAWKEVFVFLALFISWPKKKKLVRALLAIFAIIIFNVLRLDFLIFFPGTFDYFHPGLRYASIAVILLVWTWSIGLTFSKFLQGIGLKEKRARAKKPKKAKSRR